MASVEDFVTKIKPSLDAFLRAPSRESVRRLYEVFSKFQWLDMKIYNSQILLPLLLKLDELQEANQDLQTGTLKCMTLVLSKIYLNDVKAVRTMLIVIIKQIRERAKDVSEELKLAAVECLSMVLRRATTDVLEQFYSKESTVILAQLLWLLVELLERERFKKLVLATLECLMVMFYVHDEADAWDVVLRTQVAETLFIFLPRLASILFKNCLGDEKLAESIKCTSIKALGLILTLMYEQAQAELINTPCTIDDFKRLVQQTNQAGQARPRHVTDEELLGSNKRKEEFVKHLEYLQCQGRTSQWYRATAAKLQTVLLDLTVLRSHESVRVREQYALMCTRLLLRCGDNLGRNFITTLESTVAMLEDPDEGIRLICSQALQQVQSANSNSSLFEESCDVLFDEHLLRLPRIINRGLENEQYAELLFLKSFLRCLSSEKLLVCLSIPSNFQMFSACLLEAVDLNISRDLLAEEYALRKISEEDLAECHKLPWRTYKKLSSPRCVRLIEDICFTLGSSEGVNQLMFDHLLALLMSHNAAMNEILLLLLWLCTGQRSKGLAQSLMQELLKEEHWHLALEPDESWRSTIDENQKRPSFWFVDRTPGLYESAIEIRKQNRYMDQDVAEPADTVTIADVQFNVLHTCIVLDVLGHCALLFGQSFDKYMFRVVHRVLLKLSHSNTNVYQAGVYALTAMQKALNSSSPGALVDSHIDYVIHHLNVALKRSPKSRSAIDILTAALQFSSSKALPHLAAVSETIREECSKAHNAENMPSYLKAFNAFLTCVAVWQRMSEKVVNDIEPMQLEDGQDVQDTASHLYSCWLSILENHTNSVEEPSLNDFPTNAEEVQPGEEEPATEDSHSPELDKTDLPQHIQVVKDIVNQVLKFLSATPVELQILSVECLITGVPLLSNYQNDLLPLVHLIWAPLVVKFRQRDPLVLNRCFTLLSVLATHAKDFILKRSLDDVVPFLKEFLREAAARSAKESSLAQTQEYKLQYKLLKEFPDIIQSLRLEGKHLNEICEVVSLYLSQNQPMPLQDLATTFYQRLRPYNGPLVYWVVSSKSHLKDCQANAKRVLKDFKVD